MCHPTEILGRSKNTILATDLNSRPIVSSNEQREKGSFGVFITANSLRSTRKKIHIDTIYVFRCVIVLFIV